MARKRIYTRSTSVSLTEEMYDLIKDITDRQEMSISDFVRGAVLMRLGKTQDDHEHVTTNQKEGEKK